MDINNWLKANPARPGLESFVVYMEEDGEGAAAGPLLLSSSLLLARTAYERAARTYPDALISLHGPTGELASHSPSGRREIVNGNAFILPPLSRLCS